MNTTVMNSVTLFTCCKPLTLGFLSHKAHDVMIKLIKPVQVWIAHEISEVSFPIHHQYAVYV